MYEYVEKSEYAPLEKNLRKLSSVLKLRCGNTMEETATMTDTIISETIRN